LHDERKTLHDDLEAPSNHSSHPELPTTAAVDERSFDMEIEPFFPKHRQKRGEKCTYEGAEQDGLNLNRGSLLTWCHRDAELTWDPGGALGSIVRTIKPISL